MVSGRVSKVVNISIPVEDMTDLIAAIFMNTDAVAGVLENHSKQLDPVERIELQTVVMFGDAMVDMLSVAIGIEKERIDERVEALARGTKSATTVDPNEILVHANKSNDGRDFLVKSLFGDKYS